MRYTVGGELWGHFFNYLFNRIGGGEMNGTYAYALDSKGRLFIPAKLRETLGDILYICKGLDGSLFVYGLEDWKAIEKRLSEMPISRARKLQLMLFPSAVRVELDAQGRALIPQTLRDYAGLCKDAVVLGAGNRAEIWSAESWQRFEETEITSEQMAAAMDELGF